MKIFECPNCHAAIFFENTMCQQCNKSIGYNHFLDTFEIPNTNNTNFSKLCSNYNVGVCNWLVDSTQNEKFCLACSLNRTVPNPTNGTDFEKWKKLEIAKHRLIYQLLKLQLPVHSKITHANGITFDFLSENNEEGVLTGHDNGVVTIILSEADSAHREQLKKQMNEAYRTLLGHFRHEIGHYYWELLFNEANIKSYRANFGDERLDYGEALKKHYNNGAPKDWNQNYISEYASSHSWEDWAETWAHYLHIMDTLETANSFGIYFNPEKKAIKKLAHNACPNPYETKEFNTIFEASLSLTCAANSLNRSMGLPDIYPFVVPNPVIKKITFIHNLLNNRNF